MTKRIIKFGRGDGMGIHLMQLIPQCEFYFSIKFDITYLLCCFEYKKSIFLISSTLTYLN